MPRSIAHRPGGVAGGRSQAIEPLNGADVVCNWGQLDGAARDYAHREMPIGRTDTKERLARIEQMIEEYRGAKEDRLLKRAIKALRKAEVQKQLVELEAEPDRIH